MSNMKKRVLSIILILFLILNISLMLAQENQTKIDNAYDCLEEKVGDCSSLTSPEDKIFSLLAIGECQDEVSSNLDNRYSEYEDNVKLTAQAILALERVNVNTEEAQEWLYSQNATPDNMDWLLQIESTEETICTISYEGSSFPNIVVGEDKTINDDAGACLTRYGGDYWLRISHSCYDYEFEISCDNSFSTNLLYKKTEGTSSDILYVSGDTSTASPGGATTEQVHSLCFTQDGTCDYEASLWAARVLDFVGYDISSYLPYLVTMRDESENQQYLPESFLYSLTGDFRGELLSTPLPVSNDRYYDTALAFLPFQGETLEEKTDAIDWLLEEGTQGNDGCWNGGNIRDTAFILYSLWPRTLGISGGGDEGLDCESSGYYCSSPFSCSEAGGNELDEYKESCFGTNICCTKQLIESCDEQGGEVCGSDEQCSISLTEASDTSECCLGSCRTVSEKTECELYGDGNCRTSCYSTEEEAEYDCPSNRVCCIEKVIEEKKSYWWIWVLIILIILVVLGIIFKDKFRQLWFKFKTKVLSKIGKGKGKGKGMPGPRPGFPPSRPGMPPRRPIPRRALPPSQRQAIKKPTGKPKREVEDVLKKLKEMGK